MEINKHTSNSSFITKSTAHHHFSLLKRKNERKRGRKRKKEGKKGGKKGKRKQNQKKMQ